MVKQIFFILNFIVFYGHCQKPDFVEFFRDSSYSKIFESEISPYSNILEYGEMKVSLNDSTLGFVQNRRVLYRFDTDSVNLLPHTCNIKTEFKNKIILLYGTKSTFYSSFEEKNIDNIKYMKYKGVVLLFYNQINLLTKEMIVDCSTSELKCFIEESFLIFDMFRNQ